MSHAAGRVHAARPRRRADASRRAQRAEQDAIYLVGILVLTVDCAVGSILRARHAERRGAAT